MNKLLKGILIGAGAAAGTAVGAVFGLAGLFYAVAFKRELPKGSEKILGANDDKEKDKETPDLYEEKKNETKEWLKKQKKADMYITSEDGLKLYGQMLWAEKESMNIAFVVHGFHGEPAGDFSVMIPWYHEHGYNVLMIDDRAHRKSEGELLGFGWKDRRDIVCWCRQLVRLFGEEAKIVLSGVSMGGAAVMMASGEEDLPPQVRVIIEDCGFSSVRAQFEHNFPKQIAFLKKPVLGAADAISVGMNGFSFSEASALKQLRKNTRPILFIHGGDDDFVPTAMVYENYEAANEPKQLLIVADAPHAGSAVTDTAGYTAAVEGFLKQYL